MIESMVDTQSILDKYVELAVSWGDALNQGNSKNANKLHRRLSKLTLEIEKDESLSRELVYQLLDHVNLSVKSWTIVEAFRLGIRVDKAEQLLHSIVSDLTIDPSVGGVRSMAYIVWLEYRKDKTERKIYLGEK